MTDPRTKYTEEYRRETADCIISTGRPAATVAAELGLHQKTASRWVLLRKKALNGEVPAPEEDAELRALRKRNRELEMENEFLKKAALGFNRSAQHLLQFSSGGHETQGLSRSCVQPPGNLIEFFLRITRYTSSSGKVLA